MASTNPVPRNNEGDLTRDRQSFPSSVPATTRGGWRWRHYAPEVLPNIVGYGLLVLFALDIVQVGAAYRPFHPEDDQALILQVLERIAVPLVAYVMIFWWEPANPKRFELRIRKLLSMASLAIAVGCAALAVMAVHSGFRLHTRTATAIAAQAEDREANLQHLSQNLPTLSPALVQNTYAELIRRGRGEMPANLLSVEAMRSQIASAVPQAIATSRAAANEAVTRAGRLQFLTSAKYFIGGIVSAMLFFLIWDATASARAFVFFGRRADPSFTASERVDRIIEACRIVPDFNEYRWYRRIRREWQYWRDKRATHAARRSHQTRGADR